MMGAGKSSVASLLAETLNGFSCVDIDIEIEKTAKKQISEIFAEFGETYFRDLETKVLKSVLKNKNQIIATGGGIVEREENRNLLSTNGLIFYLKASANELYNRVAKTTHRPLLQKENPQKIIEELLEKRENYYKMADFEIFTENKKVSEVVKEIVEKYETL